MSEVRLGLVDVAWLHAHRDDANVKIVDATYYLPNEQRDALALFHDAHIEGAVFFDIDACVNANIPLPHMLPSAAQFAKTMGELGIDTHNHVIIYDQKGLFSAARLWWMLRVFGHDDARVSVLDGGLPAWQAAGYAVTDVCEKPAACVYEVAAVNRHMVCDMDDVMYAVASHDALIVDARAAQRFNGQVDEPRAGMRKGHIPFSVNVPYATVLDADTAKLKSEDELVRIFAVVGVDDAQAEIILSCGSGVTACVLALALHQLGYTHVRVYDGSWAEWGASDETPVSCPQQLESVA